jgi:hypothetical protein
MSTAIQDLHTSLQAASARAGSLRNTSVSASSHISWAGSSVALAFFRTIINYQLGQEKPNEIHGPPSLHQLSWFA